MVKTANPFVGAILNIAESQDIGSFKKIFEYFGPRLKSFLMKSGAEENVAEEIIQETMTIIWTKADYYDPKVASPSTWIYTIARNKKIDILRKSRKAILEDIETAVLPAIEPKTEENIEHDQKFDMIAQHLDALPKDQLDLLKMNFFEEKSHGEISDLTGIPLGTVKSRIRLALEKIRGKLDKNGAMADLKENEGSISIN
jgi:RNA polymerase sigma-70 factor (ECF subfamily)